MKFNYNKNFKDTHKKRWHVRRFFVFLLKLYGMAAQPGLMFVYEKSIRWGVQMHRATMSS